MDYPNRPRFFANRFVRLLAKMCAAQEIGPEACWMLTVIAITEDARGYRPPGVTFFNEQLAPMSGFGSVDSLARARKKAIAAGWLHYEAGGKGRAGRYWVVIPGAFEGVDDAPSDEGHDVYLRTGADNQTPVVPRICGDNPQASAETTARQPAGKCGDNPQASAEHSSLSLTQELIPPSPRGAAEWFKEFWEAYPNKARKQFAQREWDTLPITPDLIAEIMAGLDRWQQSGQWAKDGGQYIPAPANWLRERRWTETPFGKQAATNGKPTIAETIARLERERIEKEEVLTAYENPTKSK